ncbi:MAG: hypothetical protein RSD47_00820 [Romboutsia sp.]
MKKNKGKRKDKSLQTLILRLTVVSLSFSILNGLLTFIKTLISFFK